MGPPPAAAFVAESAPVAFTYLLFASPGPRAKWVRHLTASQRRWCSPLYSLPVLAPEQYACNASCQDRLLLFGRLQQLRLHWDKPCRGHENLNWYDHLPKTRRWYCEAHSLCFVPDMNMGRRSARDDVSALAKDYLSQVGICLLQLVAHLHQGMWHSSAHLAGDLHSKLSHLHLAHFLNSTASLQQTLF